jgi:oligoendopeptidase F
MALRVQQEGAPALARRLEVLKAGGTRTPLELMRQAGVDMGSPQPIHDAVAHVGRLIDELESAFD